jgi:hypothetical protein
MADNLTYDKRRRTEKRRPFIPLSLDGRGLG